MWDCQNYTACFRIPTVDIQMCIKWCGHDINLIFSGGIDCEIHAYDPKEQSSDKDSAKYEKYTTKRDPFDASLASTRTGGNKQEEVYHTGFILDLLPIPELKYIASASADSNLCLWDMTTLKGKSIHTCHNSKIYSLDWVEN